MSTPSSLRLSSVRRPGLLLLAAAALGVAALPAPAAAYWRGGVWIGIGGPPVYYAPPPPVYYGPPPAYYAPPPPGYDPGYQPAQASPPPGYQASQGYPPAGNPGQSYQGPYGTTCYAGNYTCALPAAGPVGATCSCPGLGAPSFGSIH